MLKVEDVTFQVEFLPVGETEAHVALVQGKAILNSLAPDDREHTREGLKAVVKEYADGNTEFHVLNEDDEGNIKIKGFPDTMPVDPQLVLSVLNN